MARARKRPVEILTEAEVNALIRACSKRCPTGLRNRALIVLLYRTGIRVGEAVLLSPRDVDVERGTVQVLNGKGKRSRTVGLDEASLAILEHWLERRRELPGVMANSPLFCTLAGGRLSTNYARDMLRRKARKAGIPKRVHPHGLRHSHAAELAREGVPMNVIQAQLGHASLSVTSAYLDHVAPVTLIETMRRRSWTPPT